MTAQLISTLESSLLLLRSSVRVQRRRLVSGAQRGSKEEDSSPELSACPKKKTRLRSSAVQRRRLISGAQRGSEVEDSYPELSSPKKKTRIRSSARVQRRKLVSRAQRGSKEEDSSPELSAGPKKKTRLRSSSPSCRTSRPPFQPQWPNQPLSSPAPES